MIRLKQLLFENIDQWLGNTTDANPFHIIDRNRDVIAYAFGEKITGVLAAGNNGVVYELAAGKLLKITPDASEVAAVIKLKRLPRMRHLISYYDVRNITNLFKQHATNTWTRTGDEPLEYIATPVENFYAIIMSRVTPLAQHERDAWRNHYMDFLIGSNTSKEFFDEIDLANEPMQVKEFWRKIFPQRTQIQKDFKRANINFAEAHHNNVGFDEFGQLVHFDPWLAGYGWSSPTINKKRLNKPIQLPTKFTTDGIDTPNDPTM